MSGVRLVSKEEEGRQRVKGDDGNGLWNAQLFPPPALVPVPDCPSGSARMEPLQASHSSFTADRLRFSVGFRVYGSGAGPRARLPLGQCTHGAPAGKSQATRSYH